MKSRFAPYLAAFSIAEYYTLLMNFIYLIATLIFFTSIKNSLLFSLENIAVISFIFLIEKFTRKYENIKHYNLYRTLYLMPFVFLIFNQTHYILPAINPIDIDYKLIEIDKFLFFGHNPTELLYKISNPILTEYLQISYFSFFFLPMIVGIELSLRRREEEMHKFAQYIIFGFFFSYLLYFFFPAIGPRFTLHNFANLSSELPGLYFSEYMREIVNAGSNVSTSMKNPELAVNRDCFPSGHTMMTMMVMILAFKMKAKVRYIMLLIGMSLIFSTIYLRYHYVIDVLAGILSALIALRLEPLIDYRIKQWKKRSDKVLKNIGN